MPPAPQENSPEPLTSHTEPATSGKPSVWDLKKKQRAGEELTAEERALVRAYEAKYGPCQISVYFPSEALQRYRAEAKGRPFSPWIVNQIDLSLLDKTPAEQELQAKVDRVIAERDNLRSQIGQLATENAEANRRERNHADALRRIAERIARLREDGEEEAA